jgi:hypothetical protein
MEISYAQPSSFAADRRETETWRDLLAHSRGRGFTLRQEGG